MSADTLAKYLKDKDIYILGFGREGKSTYNFIRRFFPEKKLAIGDMNEIKTDDRNVTVVSGEKYLDEVKNHELVIKSPGIPFLGNVTWGKGTEITCQTDLFLKFTDCTTVGVTGTKGKTTTSTLIYKILDKAGFDVCITGNIGEPVFEEIYRGRGTIAVIEMSSHQLEFTKVSPRVSVITNIYQEHLDHYKDGFSGYVNAKLNIVRHQKPNDYFIYNADQGLSDYIDLDKIPSSKTGVKEGEYRNLAESNPHLQGLHNSMDVSLAAAAAKCFDVNDEDIISAINEYSGIPYRMENIGEYDGVKYINDSIATIPQATEALIDAVKNIGTIIIGGLDRGIDYSHFIDVLMKSDIENIVCMPDTGYSIADKLKKQGCKSNLIKAENMDEAVKYAVTHTPKGSACVLSPAAASYNDYNNFEEKGDDFKAKVKKYADGGLK